MNFTACRSDPFFAVFVTIRSIVVYGSATEAVDCVVERGSLRSAHTTKVFLRTGG